MHKNRMKQAYQHRFERVFEEGDWVFLRLQPYKELSLKQQRKKNQPITSMVHTKSRGRSVKQHMPQIYQIKVVPITSFIFIFLRRRQDIITKHRVTYPCLMKKETSYWNLKVSQPVEKDPCDLERCLDIYSSRRPRWKRMPLKRFKLFINNTCPYQRFEEKAFA